MTARLLLIFLLTFLGFTPSFGESLRPCHLEMARLLRLQESRLSISESAAQLRPGQSDYGTPRVDYLLDKIRSDSFKKLQKYLDERPIPYVLDPNGRRLISDRHHMFLGFLKGQSILKTRFPGKHLKISYSLGEDFTGRDLSEFQRFLEDNNLVFLRSSGQQIGWSELPSHFDQMKQDYFRGMAWVLKKAEVMDDTGIAFAEFQWADRLRESFPELKTDWSWSSIEAAVKFIQDHPDDFRSLAGFKEEAVSIEVARKNLKKYARILGWNEKKVLTLGEAISMTVPGQVNYGAPRIKYLLKRFENDDFQSIQHYLSKRPLPYVVTPKGTRMISDRHHLFIALSQAQEIFKRRFPDQELKINYKFLKSFEGKKTKKFRKWLEENKLVHLESQGRSVSWDQLPSSFSAMSEDYYRGVAWILKKAGVYDETDIAFVEFQWAKLLREKLPTTQEVYEWEKIEQIISFIKENPSAFKVLPGFKEDMPSLEEAWQNFKKYAN